ncbi:hypothetical protein ACTU46_06090 [Corynebacterium sp. A21]
MGNHAEKKVVVIIDATFGFGVAIEEALSENRPARRRRPGQRRQYPC